MLDIARIVLVGSVRSSEMALQTLVAQGVKPVAVLTLYPDLAHRHADYVDLSPLAKRYDIPVVHVKNINYAEPMAKLREINPDYIFVIGWSQLLKPALLSLPKKSCIGFHTSMLPHNRGRALLPWTILSQVDRSGATLFHLADGIDDGDILSQRGFDIAPDETAMSLYGKINHALQDMLIEIAPLLHDNDPLPATPQDHSQATYFAKRTAEDGWVDWSASADDIWRLIRASGKPYPGAFTVYKNKEIVIWESRLREQFKHRGTIGQILTLNDDSVTVQCGQAWLDLITVQEKGGQEVPASHYFKKVHEKLGISAFQLWKMHIND